MRRINPLSIHGSANSTMERSTLDTLQFMAFAYHERKNYDCAEATYKRLLDLQERLFGENDERLATTFYNLGELYSEKGCPSSADEYYVKAKQLLNHHKQQEMVSTV